MADKTQSPENPRKTANLLSSLSFWWVNPLMKLGYRKDLEVKDLYSILPNEESETLGLHLQTEWMKELTKLTSSGPPSLTRALIRTFGMKFALMGLFPFFEQCISRVVQPLCLAQVIRYFTPDAGGMSTESAYLYAAGVVLCSALNVLTHHQFFMGSELVGLRLRVACCSLLYRKYLVLSQKALGQTSVGHVVNLMSNDVRRFDTFAWTPPHFFLIGPIQALIIVLILLLLIGPSCLTGLSILILFIPLQSFMSRIFSKFRAETAKRTDARIRTMNEILTGMRVIKMYTWEKPFAKLIDFCRRMEIDVIRKTAYCRAINESLFFTSSKLILFITFAVYVVTGNHLTADKVFLTVALFDNIRNIMTLYFPAAIAVTAEAKVSIKRIQNFLLLEEKECNVAHQQEQPSSSQQQFHVELKQVTTTWPSAAFDSDLSNTLTNISFTAEPGQLIAVVGHVGSGKSSLLNVILGELPPVHGSCRVNGKIAYASQEPWIFAGTIRQNILCGLEYDENRYKRVIQASALQWDLHLFPLGDGTAVGERGIQLSGGQKARVNLARCLYIEADVYLLDDPLSAVDNHVGRHLFDHAINGYLRNKIRILVTHQLQYLQDADRILVLNGGQLEAIGTFQELKDIGIDLAKSVEEEDLEVEVTKKQGNLLSPDICHDNGSLKRFRSSSNRPHRRNQSGTSSSKHSSKRGGDPQNPVIVEEEEESRESGGVTWSIYWNYFRSGAGGYVSLMILISTCILAEAFFCGSDYWLSIWTDSEELRFRNVSLLNFTDSPRNISHHQSWHKEVDSYMAIYVYAGLIGGLFVFSIIRAVRFYVLCMNASINLHNRMFEAVIRSPLSFFDKNPVGRVLNRFAKDIGCMDDQLPPTFFEFLYNALSVLGVVVVVGVVNLWLLLPIIFLAVFFYKLREIYLKTSLNVRRLEATTKSPIFTHLSSSLVGLTTLRAHKGEKIFQRIFDECQNVHSSAWCTFLGTSHWFGIWLDWIVVVYMACVTFTCLALRDVISGSEAGLVITSVIIMAVGFQWTIRQSAEVANQMTSVERVIEYSNMPSEAPLDSNADSRPPTSWPHEGSIQFDKMTLKYNETSGPPVLKSISCHIKAKEKVGIVGRTGAGKSSLISALFRLAEPEGRIVIDGIDVRSLGLHELRSKISIIPQDPFLFTGTLRKNLDPFDEFKDEQILLNALEDVKVKESIGDSSAGLDFIVTEGGSNLSVGQRQLVCLARAILRKNRILVLDEATANVDQKTDELIQLTIRDKFKDCTVLTVAHRLNTIMDSDKVMVMDTGYLMEFDEPAALLGNPQSLFYGLVEQAGNQVASVLTSMAKQATEQRIANKEVSENVIPSLN